MIVDAEHLGRMLVRRSPQDGNGFTEFRVHTEGSLTGGAKKVHAVLIRGYTDGIACTSFGQSNVAVVGLSSSGEATLLTASGEFVISSDALTVGCPDCIAPSNSGSRRLSPSWDLVLTGHRAEQLFQTRDGLVAIEVPDGCIVFSDPFASLSVSECATIRSPISLEIQTGACT